MNRNQVLSQRTVEDMITRGDTIIVFQDYVLRLDSWLPKHPGGSLAILHMVGRDATDEITAYHSTATLRTMKAYRIGRKPAGIWINRIPPIRGGMFGDHDTLIPSAGASECSMQIAGNISGDGFSGTSNCSYPKPCKSSSTSMGGFDKRTDVTSGLDGAGRRRQPAPDKNEHAYEFSSVVSDNPVGPYFTSPQYMDWAVQQGIDKALQDYPSLDLAVQQDVVSKYRELHQKIIDEGLYNCPYQEYAKEMARYICLFLGSLVAVRHDWYVTSATLLGLFWHQIMFTAHDAGHQAISHVFVVDTLIGMAIADLCCGLSIGWWKSSHNIHHLVTNQPEHDPDIQNVPLFAICPSFFRSITSTYYNNFVFAWNAAAGFMVPYQKYTYYPIMAIARFNLYVLSWLHVLSPKTPSLAHSKAWWIRPTEIAFMCCYWFLFGYCLLWLTLPTWTVRVVYVLVSHIITMPLHVQINLSHWGMSTSNLGESESFAQRQLRATMDIDCPAWLDPIHGGLQFQAVHHLFPRVPRHNLRKAQTLVKGFCQETGIPYSILGFVDGNRKVLGRLQEVSDQLKMLIDCQKSMAENGECSLH